MFLCFCVCVDLFYIFFLSILFQPLFSIHVQVSFYFYHTVCILLPVLSCNAS